MQRKTFQFNGIRLSYIDSETPGKNTILIAHANGFSAACYSYLIRRLSPENRVLALDFCGHGESEPSLDWKNWFFFRDQILTLIEKENLKDVVGIGHSLGGASLLLASYQKPNLFRKIFVMDPVVLNFPVILATFFIGNPLAKGALKRRREFKDLNIVRKAYRKSPTFARWAEEPFEDYLSSCLKEENGKLVLCCPPELEAKIFNSVHWKSLLQYGRISSEVHITIPKDYEVCSPKAARRIVKGNPNSSLEIWPGTNHFFPFEEPDKTYERILSRL
ncbi:alpha/beta fold hydrolase [Leptospira wolffii]|uniref:alpha/beta fold hydrolase n=1 Tax=Leptospira wolffii TaxID=409998 RepID=UPI0002E57784|nr:alpha/beta hydrolase [Leptospira wolffii]EPG68254.1 alpha/beta hydrolase family protein [Leptospira wolffii serovar Khorat str. Khorat-H2]